MSGRKLFPQLKPGKRTLLKLSYFTTTFPNWHSEAARRLPDCHLKRRFLPQPEEAGQSQPSMPVILKLKGGHR